MSSLVLFGMEVSEYDPSPSLFLPAMKTHLMGHCFQSSEEVNLPLMVALKKSAGLLLAVVWSPADIL
jgi:hypothetical protein